MTAGNSADSFLDLLQQSGLVDDDQILQLRDEFGGEAVSARDLADTLVNREVITRWQADMLLKGKHRGFHLGAHRILRPLGQGGMSKVFLAEHEMMRRLCAIKVLPSKYQSDPDLLSRFHLEARAIAALDHRHIVRAYDFNKDVRYGKEIHYLVMEYVDGPDLRKLVDESGPLDYRKATDYIRQAAEGLVHAHQAGFVHRDIKPANLLVDQNGLVKVLDLGLARFTFEGEQPWQTSEGEPSAVGTADYVAPEQVADSRNVDGRADLYSLGLTFYFLLTGRRPFPKSTLPELLMAHRKEQPEPISKLRPDVPLELIEIVDRMISKEPIRRFQTAQEVADKLQAWLDEEAGGGDYSRISALMAAAMRSKQPSDQDEAKTGSRDTEASVLELASLDEEAASQPTKETNAKNTATEAVKPPLPKRSPPALKRSVRDEGRPSSSNIRADVLAELLPQDKKSASNSDPLLMPQGDAGYLASPRFRRRGGPMDFLKSPWFWSAVIWLIAAILLLFLLFRPSSSDGPAEKSPEETAMETNRDDNISDFLDSPIEFLPSDPPSLVPSLPSSEPQEVKPLESTPPAKASEDENLPEAPLPDEKPAPPESKPVEPKLSEDEKPLEAKPSTPTEKKPDLSVLLAGVKKVSVKYRSSDNDPSSALNITVKRQVTEALKQLGIEVDKAASSLMLIDVRISDASDAFTVKIFAIVACPIENYEKPVAVWQLSKQVLSVPSKRIRPDQILRVLRIGAKDFFDQFVDAVRKARIDAKFK